MEQDNAALREENEALKKEVEELIRAREIAKEKVRRAIQELVDENKRLRAKITSLEEQINHWRVGDGKQSDEDKMELERGDQPGDANGTGENVSSSDADDDYMDDDYNDEHVAPTQNVVPGVGNVDKLRKMLNIPVNEVVEAATNEVNNCLTKMKPGLLMMKNPEDNVIDVRGGTVEKLVKRLYQANTELGRSPDYVSTFVLTHVSFCQTGTVLNMLVKDYLAALDDGGDLKLLKNKFKRRRILDVLKTWVDLQPEHFYGEGLDEFKQFVKTVMLEKEGSRAKPLWKKISKVGLSPEVIALNMDAAKRKKKIKKDIPKPLFPKSGIKINSIEDIHIEELARQLTLLDHELFQKIRMSEYLGLAWMKPQKEINSPNLLRVSQRFNEVSRWIQYQIVSNKVLRKRANMYQLFVKLGQAFRKYRNYNGIMQIISALDASPVHRLKKNMLLKANTLRKYSELRELMSYDSSYKYYREALATCPTPAVPFMGVWQTDLTYIDESHKKTLEPQHPDFINFSKYGHIAKIMRTIINFQQTDYPLQPLPCVREWLEAQISTYGSMDEDQLFALSLEAEPRTS